MSVAASSPRPRSARAARVVPPATTITATDQQQRSVPRIRLRPRARVVAAAGSSCSGRTLPVLGLVLVPWNWSRRLRRPRIHPPWCSPEPELDCLGCGISAAGRVRNLAGIHPAAARACWRTTPGDAEETAELLCTTKSVLGGVILTRANGFLPCAPQPENTSARDSLRRA
jgi:hypothetical protein